MPRGGATQPPLGRYGDRISANPGDRVTFVRLTTSARIERECAGERVVRASDDHRACSFRARSFGFDWGPLNADRDFGSHHRSAVEQRLLTVAPASGLPDCLGDEHSLALLSRSDRCIDRRGRSAVTVCMDRESAALRRGRRFPSRRCTVAQRASTPMLLARCISDGCRANDGDSPPRGGGRTPEFEHHRRLELNFGIAVPGSGT